jgi:hypothetical protein
MSGYHSIELCYLSATYTNLLITQTPLDLYFKPKAASFADNVLRVAPDLLPPGAVKLTDVWVNDQPYTDFDADALTVNLPAGEEVRVHIRLTPISDKFDVSYELTDGVARVTLKGILEPDQLPTLRRQLERAVADGVSKTILVMNDLTSMCREGINELVFIRQKMDIGEDCLVVGSNEQIAQLFRDSEAIDEFQLVDAE